MLPLHTNCKKKYKKKYNIHLTCHIICCRKTVEENLLLAAMSPVWVFVSRRIPATLWLCCRYSIHSTFYQAVLRHIRLSVWLAALGYFFPSAHIRFLLGTHLHTRGLECFLSVLSDSGALCDCFPGSEQHAARAGGTTHVARSKVILGNQRFCRGGG